MTAPVAMNPAPGLPIEEVKSVMTLDAITCAKGDILALKQDGTRTKLIVPTTAELQYGEFCVCLAAQPVTSGDVFVLWRGDIDEAKLDGTVAVALTDALIAVNGARNLADGTAATGCEKIIARPREAYSTAAVALKKVSFNGLEGFGQVT